MKRIPVSALHFTRTAIGARKSIGAYLRAEAQHWSGGHGQFLLLNSALKKVPTVVQLHLHRGALSTPTATD
jgi:hypothetical protein